MKLIAGLGNPGPAYERTRHNAGYWFIDALAARYGAVFKAESRFRAEVARVTIGAADVRLLKPAVYMNESGPSVASAAAYYKIAANETLVAHDELSLACGIVQLKRGGGHGGHNGVRDICTHFAPDFNRLRIGIDHPGQHADVARYVLNVPPALDEQAIAQAIADAVAKIEQTIAGAGAGGRRARRKT